MAGMSSVGCPFRRDERTPIECAAMDAKGGSCAAIHDAARTRRAVAALPHDLTTMIHDIRARAPSARIVMVT